MKKSAVDKYRGATTPPEPPRKLGVIGRRIYHDLTTTYGITDVAGLLLVTKYCRVEEDIQIMRRKPEASRDTSKITTLESLQLKILAALHLDIEPLKRNGPGRPNGSGALRQHANQENTDSPWADPDV